MAVPSRRHFLGALASAVGLALLPTSDALGAGTRRVRRLAHPTPRPGITAAKVLTAEQLASRPQLVPLFDDVRAMPEIVDGIRCSCGCANQPGNYSLLSCYEGENAMAKWCPVCQGQGRLAARLRKEGKTLDEIRAAIDAKYG